MGQPNCIPALLRLSRGSPEAREATVFWTGAITSLLLIGWAAGGLLFGWLGDRLGRKRALFVTIVVYAVGTALLAESVPENRRVEGRTRLARNRRTTRALRCSSPPGWQVSSCTRPLRSASSSPAC
jgi:hypothetical protein